MQDRSVEHRLREEYFDCLPEIRRVLWQLETEIRFRTLPILHDLKGPEQLVIRSRVKDCESALRTLARLRGSPTPEGRQFDPERVRKSTQFSVFLIWREFVCLSFLIGGWVKLTRILRPYFEDWAAKPVKNDHGEIIAPKYYGYCRERQLQNPGRVPDCADAHWAILGR